MRKIIVFMTLGFLLTYPLEAIDIEGKLIIKNDTMNVTFDIPLKFLSEEINYERLQNKVKYYDSTGTIITLRPDTPDFVTKKN